MKALPLTLFAACAVTSLTSQAAELDIKLTNLTQGLHFTPILITAHTNYSQMFNVATPASMALQAMAEGGNIEPLMNEAAAANNDMVANPAEGLLAPTSSTMASLTTSEGNNYLSLTAMLLPTNDGFVGLDSWMIPSEAGTYTLYLNAYDAGTEANDERVVDGSGAIGMPGIPAAPGGNDGMNASGVTSSESNMMVHIHPGNLGDDDPEGGMSDLNNTVHRWLNPVAMLTITVK